MYASYICHRKLDSDIEEDVLLRIQEMFGVERQEASELLSVLMECMEYRELVSSITLFVTLDHKTSQKSQFFEIEIYTSSESWINNLYSDA